MRPSVTASRSLLRTRPDLERDLALEAGVLRQPDCALAALPELAEENAGSDGSPVALSHEQRLAPQAYSEGGASRTGRVFSMVRSSPSIVRSSGVGDPGNTRSP